MITQPFIAPPGWPIVDRGLLMTHIGSCVVVYIDARMTDATYDLHIKELARAIDLRQSRVVVLYDAPSLRGLDARRRKSFAEMLESRQEQLAKTTAAYALVTGSSVIRGMLNALFWLAPPPYKWTIEPTPRAGFEFLSKHLPGLDPAKLDLEYQAALSVYSRRLGSPVTGAPEHG